MIDIARRKATAASISNIEFQCSTLEDFVAEDASFDVVMAHNFLHLLEDPEQAIRTSYRLLKPGGVFVTSTAYLADSFSRWRIMLIIMNILRKAPYVNVLKRVTLEKFFAVQALRLTLSGGERNRPRLSSSRNRQIDRDLHRSIAPTTENQPEPVSGATPRRYCRPYCQTPKIKSRIHL